MILELFPAPRKATVRDAVLDLRAASWVVLPERCSHRLADRVRECSGAIGRLLCRPIRVSAAAPESGEVLLTIRTGVGEGGEQGFRLTLNRRARALAAGDEAGAYYGMLAFAQLIRQFGEAVPTLTISDSPDFAARGVMLDVSRCKVPTMATCRQLIDRLSGMRINRLQLYTEHTFAFSAHRTVWADASPFTHEEILDLDRYCHDRFVELVPNFNSFGHFERWLRHPEYRHLAECPDREGCCCLAPTGETLRFLDGLYDEFLPQFSSASFNVGCDETWDLGEGRSKSVVAKRGKGAVYLEFLNALHGLCGRRGRRMQFWGDIIRTQPDLIPNLPRDVVALCWGYEATHPYDTECAAFADAGVAFHVCPGTSAWNSITGRTDNCLANIRNAAYQGAKHGATGLLNTDWGDGGHHQVLPISYVGFAAGASCSWGLKRSRDADLAGALDRHLFGDVGGVLGQFCLDLGRTGHRIPGLVRSNCSCLHQLLFANPGRPDLSEVTADQYDDALGWLTGLSDALRRARPGCADADLVLRELDHALAMSRHAIHRGMHMQFGSVSGDALRRELRELVMGFEEQWLARNRRGGLHESSARLRGTGNIG